MSTPVDEPVWCRFIQDADGAFSCQYCGRRWRPREPWDGKPPRANCLANGDVEFYALPGNQLHKMIVEMFGEQSTGQCGCAKWIARMNRWGVEGCRKNLDKIAARLVRKVKKHHWTTDTPGIVKLAKFGTAIPFGTNLVHWRCRKVVEEAIRRAESVGTSG